MQKQYDMMMGGTYKGPIPKYPPHLSERVKQMLESTISEVRNLGNVLRQEEDAKHNVHVDIVRKLMMSYPEIIVGGSTALFLHGIRLKRWREKFSDLDIISPYFVKVEQNDLKDMIYREVSFEKVRSTIDFHHVHIINNKIKVDWRIDPQQHYEYIEYEDFKFKVSTLETIMGAKCRYAILGDQKHKQDIKEICQPPLGVGGNSEGSMNDDDTLYTTTTSTTTAPYIYHTS